MENFFISKKNETDINKMQFISKYKPYFINDGIALFGYCEYAKPYLKQKETIQEDTGNSWGIYLYE